MLPTSPDAAIEAALQALQERDGRTLRLVGRYRHGESGAYRVADEAGRHYALKFAPELRLKNARLTSNYLRQQSYPAPEYLAITPTSGNRSSAQTDEGLSVAEQTGERWVALIAELSGSPSPHITVELARQLFALLDCQAGRGFLPPERLRVVDTLLYGADGFAFHETMRRYSSATSALLDEIITIGQRSADFEYSCADIVHNDFHIENVLVQEGNVSGIVDWEGTCTGDRAFDVSTLLFYCMNADDVERHLWRVLLEMTGPARAAVYLAHMMLRQVEWSARHHDAATVERFLGRSRALLSQIDHLR